MNEGMGGWVDWLAIAGSQAHDVHAVVLVRSSCPVHNRAPDFPPSCHLLRRQSSIPAPFLAVGNGPEQNRRGGLVDPSACPTYASALRPRKSCLPARSLP